MTPLWARMLVFKAWENGKITKGCAQYFDEFLRDHSYFYAGESYHEYKTINEVFASVVNSYNKCYHVNNLSDSLEYYIQKMSYYDGRPRAAGTPFHSTKIYLFEVLGCDISDIGSRIESYLKQNSHISEYEFNLVQEYFSRLCATGCIQHIPTKNSINQLLEKIKSNISENNKDSNVNPQD